MNEREQLRVALGISDDLRTKVREIDKAVRALIAERDDALRRAQEAERRSAVDQQQADDMTEKAGQTVELEDAGRELVEALDRLPWRMEEAGLKQMVVPPPIPLYGTHDWEAVEQAKRRLATLIPKKGADNG